MLSQFVEIGNIDFDCSTYQFVLYYLTQPSFHFIYNLYCENIFLSDSCHAQLQLNDLANHEGASCVVEKK